MLGSGLRAVSRTAVPVGWSATARSATRRTGEDVTGSRTRVVGGMYTVFTERPTSNRRSRYPAKTPSVGRKRYGVYGRLYPGKR